MFAMLKRAEFFSVFAMSIGIVLIVQGCATGSGGSGSMESSAGGAVSFAGQIAPIFEARCTECHGGANPESGLNLSTYAGTITGSEFGSVIEVGNPDDSFLVDMIASGNMPAEGDPVPPAELELIRAWIAAGAADN